MVKPNKIKIVIYSIIIIVCVLGSVFTRYKASQDTYMIKRDYTCTVLSKIDHNYNYNVKAITHYERDFILVLQAEGKKFSLDVTPATWATCEVGDVLIFNIEPYKLDYQNSIPCRWGFWSIFVIFFSGGIIITLIICIVFEFIEDDSCGGSGSYGGMSTSTKCGVMSLL